MFLLKPVLNRLCFVLRLGWLARRAASARSEENRLMARQALAGAFTDARGVTMKVGQIVAAQAGWGEQGDAVTHAEPRPLAEMLPLLEQEWHGPIERRLDSIEKRACAASLGQVHRARLRDGRAVAVKIRYPGIERAVRSEMLLAGLVPGIGPLRRWSFDLDAYRLTIAANMQREIDYRHELAVQRENAQLDQHRGTEQLRIAGLAVPEVVPELSTSEVLVQSWEEGVCLSEIGGWALRERLAVGRALLSTLFVGWFELGKVHADPNLGNFLVRRADERSPELVVLDYGCIVHLSEPRRLAMLKLILACREGDGTDPMACLEAAGFDGQKLQGLRTELPALCQALLRPFLHDGPFATRRWALATEIDALLGELRWWFRSAGSPDLLLLLRAVAGTVHLLERLDVALPWWDLLERSLTSTTLHRARGLTLATSKHDDTVATFRSLARLLRVRVDEHGEEKVSIALPASEVLHLEENIPSSVVERLHARGTDPKTIVARAYASRFSPQELFTLTDDDHHVRVWLE